MTTKIRGAQLKKKDFIQPQASADWTRDDITASAYAIAAKIASSGVRKITTNYKIWELEEGVYHVDGTKQANYRGGSFTIYQNYYLFVANYNHVTPDKKRYIAFWELDNNGDDIEFYYGTCSASSGTLASKKLSQIKNMGGASSLAAGSAGFAPAPAAGDNTKYLRGDATWQAIPGMVGATSLAAGSEGLVPAPSAGNEGKFLRGNGTWSAPAIVVEALAIGRTPQGLYIYQLEYNNNRITKSELASALDKGILTYINEMGYIWYPDRELQNARTELVFKRLLVKDNKLKLYRMRCVDENDDEYWYNEIEYTTA